METQSYCRLINFDSNSHKNDANNVEETRLPLIVNCVGIANVENCSAMRLPIEREDFYLQYVVKGEVTQIIKKIPIKMGAGSVILHFPHTPQQHMISEKGVVCYWVHFTGFEALQTARECGFQNQKMYHVGVQKHICSDFTAMFDEFIARDSFFEVSLRQKITKLLVDFGRLIKNESEDFEDDRISSVAAYLHIHFKKEIAISTLANRVYMSEVNLRKRFKERFGISPHKYIANLRINRALELLDSTDMTVSEIASEIGYQDPLYFSKLFKAGVGASPREYRKKNRLDGG